MKRTLAAVLLLTGLGTAASAGPYMSGYWNKQTEPADGVHWGARYANEVPNLMGPYGQPVPMVAPYNANPPGGADLARAMMQQSMPLGMVQQMGFAGGLGGGLQQTAGPVGMPPGGGIAPPGLPPPPGAGIAPPSMPIAAPAIGKNYPIPPGAVNAMGAIITPPAAPFPVMRTEVKFAGPSGMKISWFAPAGDGKPGFSTQYLEAPGRYNFLQASFYRLKLYDIPNRPGVTLYPTLEVVPCKAKTAAFLAHSAVPVIFNEDDFEQVAAGNFVVKVIYLPDPQFQDLATTAPDEVVSTRLEPGMDPIVEAQRRGSILLVVRLGNIDLEAPNTPPMDAPNPFAPVPAAAVPVPAVPGAPGGAPGTLPPGQLPGAGQPNPQAAPGQLPPVGAPPRGGLPGAAPGGENPPGLPGAGAPGTPLGRLPFPPVQRVNSLPPPNGR
jgi:hypothetical protein